MIRRRGLGAAFISLSTMSIALGGCVSTPAPMTADNVTAGNASYTLGAGDKLHVIVYNEEQLTSDYVITPGGNISFPLIGNVNAAGLTPEQLQATITGKLAEGYIKDAKVTVEALNLRDYYILGEVNKPGEYPYSPGLDMQQAVAAAGGYTYRANRGKAFIRRAKGLERSVDLRGVAIGVLPGDTIRIGERYF